MKFAVQAWWDGNIKLLQNHPTEKNAEMYYNKWVYVVMVVYEMCYWEESEGNYKLRKVIDDPERLILYSKIKKLLSNNKNYSIKKAIADEKRKANRR